MNTQRDAGPTRHCRSRGLLIAGAVLAFVLGVAGCSDADSNPADAIDASAADAAGSLDDELTLAQDATQQSSTSSSSSTSTTTSTAPPPPTEVFVSPAGTDANNGTTPDTALASIDAAVARVEPGGVIWLEPGEYPPLRLVQLRGTAEAPIRIRARPGVIVSDVDLTSNAGVLIRESEHLDVRGLEIRGALWGIYVDNSHHVTVADNVITDIGQEGVRVKNGSTTIAIEGNRIADTGRRTDIVPNGEAIYIGTGSPGGVDFVDDVRIAGNVIERIPDEAIDIKRPATNVAIVDNIIRDINTATTGAVVVHLNSEDPADPNVTIERNVIRNVTRSSPHRDGNCIVTQVTTRIVNNVIHQCQHRGIYVRANSATVTILHNTFLAAGSIDALVVENGRADVLALNNLGLATTGNKPIVADTLVDPAGGDYTPREDADPQLTTGVPIGVTDDLLGATRPVSGPVTFGAVEAAPERDG